MSHSPKELAIMELAWDGIQNFDDFCKEYFEQHKDTIRKIAASNLRIPTSLEKFATYNARKKKLEELSICYILECLPIAKVGKTYTEGQYSNLAFRSWHFVSHQSFILPPFNSLKDAVWIYKIKAIGSNNSTHFHGLVEFVFAHPKEYVIEELNLPPDTLLCPIHGSFKAAKEYLDNQAIMSEQYGTMPSHCIWVCGSNIEINESMKTKAAEEGEDPIYTAPYRGNNVLPRINKYISWCLTQNFKRYTIKMNNFDEASDLALNTANNFNTQIFVINCLEFLSPFITNVPPNYSGEHVILILNADENWKNMISNANWLKSIPYIIYTEYSKN